MVIKPKCRICNQIFLGGQDGCCSPCLSGHPVRKSPKRLRCLCGRRAVAILLGDVVNADNELMLVEIALCPVCKKQEIQLEASLAQLPSGTEFNPVHVVVVKSLPRARPRLQGARIC